MLSTWTLVALILAFAIRAMITTTATSTAPPAAITAIFQVVIPED